MDVAVDFCTLARNALFCPFTNLFAHAVPDISVADQAFCCTSTRMAERV
jgi:hypothetical protein